MIPFAVTWMPFQILKLKRASAETMQLRDRERLRQQGTFGSSLEAAQVQRIEQAKR